MTTRSLVFLTVAFCASTMNAQFQQYGGKLVGSGARGGAAQGIAVAISADGSIAAIGGPSDSSGYGAVWIFALEGGAWKQVGGKLTGSGASGNPHLGSAVAIAADGKTIVVGGPADSAGFGAAWIFVRSGTGWIQQGPKLVGSGAVGVSAQGRSVAISADGDLVAVGGPFDDGLEGAVWLFSRSNGVWKQEGEKIHGTSGNLGKARQGFAVSLSADGRTVLSGGPLDFMKFGSAWVFTAGGEKVDSRYIRAITAGDTRLFAGGEGGMLFSSGNAGVHWTRISQMWLDSAVISMAAIGPVAFVGTYGKGVYMSSDAGATWTSMNTGLANKNVQALLAYDTLLFAGTDDGVFRSSDAGQNWIPTGGAIAGKVVRSLLRSSGRLFAGTENGEVYRSTDLGGWWDPANSGLPGASVLAFATMGGSLFVGTPVGVYRSVNGGNQWTQINIGLSGNQDVESFAVVGSVLFAGTYGSGVFRSTNGGDIWEPANSGIANRVVRCLAATAAGLFAGSDSGLFRSVDGGSAWQRASLGWQQEAILHLWPDGYEAEQGYAVALSGDGNTAILGGPYHARGAGGAWVFHRENGIWQSDGGGHMSGSGATNAPGYGYSVALSLDGKTAAFGGVSDEAGRGSSWVFSRTHTGWSQLGPKLVGTGGSERPGQGAAIALSGDGSTVLVGGPSDDSIGAAWVFISTMTGINGQGGEKPMGFSLAQNYPNPFNPETTIEFDVASETRVDIAVYDVLGRMVTDLVGEVKQPGHYVTRFNKAGLSSGVYFCRMHAGSFVQVRTMCLMR